MVRKSRSRKKQKKRNKLGKKPKAVNSLDSQIKSLFDKKEYSKIILLLEPLSKKTNLSEPQLSYLAFSLIEDQGKESSDKAFDFISKIKNPSIRDRKVKGWCFIYQEKWDDAVSLLEKLYEEDKTTSTLYAFCIALFKSRNIPELFGKKYSWSEIDEELKDEETVSKLKELLIKSLKNKTVYLGFYKWLEEIWYYENDEKVYEDKRNLKILNNALKIFSDDEDLRLILVKRYEQIEDLENIIKTLDWVLTAPNPSGEIFVDSIDVFLRMKKPEKALEFYEKANTLELFAGEEKEVLKVEILYKNEQIEEANSIVEKVYSHSKTSKANKFGLLVAKSSL